MSFWTAIKKAVNSNINVPLNELIGANHNALTSTVTNGSVPIVRHIQRGTVSINNDYEAPVTLSGFTNRAKMMVIFNGIYASGGAHDTYVEAYTPYIASITATNVTFKFPAGAGGRGANISYQVIEFY